MTRCVKLGQSTLSDPEAAVRDLFSQVSQPDIGLVIVYCSSRYDLNRLASALSECFGETPVVGCTTAGEIGPAGYCDHSISGASFPAEHFAVTVERLDSLKSAEVSRLQNFAQNLAQRHECSQGDLPNTFAMLLIDGVSQREDAVTRTLFNSLPGIPIVGGSTGDDLIFDETWVFYHGQFHTNSALLLMMSTRCSIAPVKTQHFVATDQRLVITAADPERRLVTEINGLPAAAEYARLTGVDVNDLNLMRFADSPVVVMIEGKEYVRSIRQANPDGSLTFYCAIEAGLVFRVARGVDLIENLRQSLDAVRQTLGTPQVLLAFDCVLRKLEMEQSEDTVKAASLTRACHTLGFNSYGEQFGGIHVNQTFTGLAIGYPEDEGS
ncbi:FIST N-terminal domain-containing protein [Saccharospirillum impatiens]|uniref:FIST N-terminal domain-containing protein n=1 Tax=Saccharospirillum impatiens TaxID=169438 RepID=UPI000490EB01|nr:FIST N-terminal domain-containing protein [Saccharospirillum impatiens]